MSLIVIMKSFPHRSPSSIDFRERPRTFSSMSFKWMFSILEASISKILIFCVVSARLSFVPATLILFWLICRIFARVRVRWCVSQSSFCELENQVLTFLSFLPVRDFFNNKVLHFLAELPSKAFGICGVETDSYLFFDFGNFHKLKTLLYGGTEYRLKRYGNIYRRLDIIAGKALENRC